LRFGHADPLNNRYAVSCLGGILCIVAFLEMIEADQRPTSDELKESKSLYVTFPDKMSIADTRNMADRLSDRHVTQSTLTVRIRPSDIRGR
jgi:hypothetical protein